MNSGAGRNARKKPPAGLARFYGLLGALAVLGIVAIAYFAMRDKPRAVAVDPNLPKGTARGYVLGSATAPVEIIEFADFECPACGNQATVTGPDVKKRLVETGQARLVFFDLPLPMHANSWPAHLAAACANDEGKFWEMHDRLFAGQHEWNGLATSNPDKVLRGYAKEIGLDAAKFEECTESERHRPQIQANLDEATRRGVRSTPTFVIGGKMHDGTIGYDEMKRLVDAAAAAAPKGTPAADSAAPRTVPAAGGAAPGAAGAR